MLRGSPILADILNVCAHVAHHNISCRHFKPQNQIKDTNKDSKTKDKLKQSFLLQCQPQRYQKALCPCLALDQLGAV